MSASAADSCDSDPASDRLLSLGATHSAQRSGKVLDATYADVACSQRELAISANPAAKFPSLAAASVFAADRGQKCAD